MIVVVVLGIVLFVLLAVAVVLRPGGDSGTDLIGSAASTPAAPAALFLSSAASAGSGDALAALDDATRWRIEELAASGRRVAAIEALRAATGCGIAAAKTVVDRIPRYGSGTAGSARFLLDEVRGLAYSGRADEAAEHLRSRTGMSPAEAQQAVRELLSRPRQGL